MNIVVALRSQSTIVGESSGFGLGEQRFTEENADRRFTSVERTEVEQTGTHKSGRDSSEVEDGAEAVRRVIIIRTRSLAEGLVLEGRAVVDKLIALLEGDERDEYGTLRPTLFSFRRTFHLISGAALQLREQFPAAFVSTDSEGGVRVQWFGPRRQVRLIIPDKETGQQYIYHQEGSEYAVESVVDVPSLMHWLNWLQADQ